MKRTVKILCGLLAALAVALSVCVLLIVIGWSVREVRMIEILAAIRRFPTALMSILAALLLGALGVFALYGLFSEHFMRRTSATIERNALGETSVSFTALADLANQIVRSHGEVKNSKTKVTANGNKIKIEVRVTTAPTISLLEFTHILQDQIAARILTVCGVPIGIVDVTVDQTDEPEKT